MLGHEPPVYEGIMDRKIKFEPSLIGFVRNKDGILQKGAFLIIDTRMTDDPSDHFIIQRIDILDNANPALARSIRDLTETDIVFCGRIPSHMHGIILCEQMLEINK